jgi:hypothetical protein
LKKEKKIERKVGQPLFGILTLTGKLPEMLKSLAYQKIPPPSRVIGMPSGK